MERSWPLTGRDDELRRIVAAIRPSTAGIVVAGPAGVGKTRLMHEAVTAAGAGDTAVVRALGSAAARPVPLGAFAGAIGLPAGDAAGAIGRTLDQLERRRLRLLLVDDAHQLDEHSALVLHRVVVRRIAPVLVTLRSGTRAPDTVTALWKDDLVPRLDLAPLGPEEVTALVARVLGGPVESASARRLWRLTEGSPLFLRHVLGGEVASGRFSPASGTWRWTSEPRITPELADLLEAEIGGLGAEVQEVVDLVALAEPVSIPTLVALTSIGALEESEDRGLVRIDGSVARLAHPLYGEVRRTAMGSLRAHRLRGRVARTLGDDDLIPRAVLTLDSDLEPEPLLFRRAAEAATRLYDLPLAERLARAAATTGEPAARRVHAATLSWLSRGEEAEAILADLAASAPDDPSRAMAHLLRSGNLLFTMARPDAARLALDEAAATGAYRLHVAAMSLAVAAAVGDVRTVLADGPDLLRSDLPDDLARILVASAISAAGAVTGDATLVHEAAVVGGLAATQVPTVIPGFGLADFQVLAHRLAGEPGRGADLGDRMRAASDELPGPARLMGLVVAGHAALAAGRVSEAVRVLTEAWAGIADSGHEFRFRCRTLLATALGQAGRAGDAAPLLAGIVAQRHPAYTLFGPDDLLARAWGAAAERATTEALGHAVAAAELARELGAPAHEVLAWQTAVQLGDSTAALAALGPLAGLGPRARTCLDHARALAGDDAGGLLDASEAWTHLGDLVAAGDAAAQAAAVHRRQGRQGSALSAAAHAARLAERSGARTPALALAVRPLPLTGREREIVALAASGHSNRQIADRLTLSVRTVEGHLYRAGRKLGVSERNDLAELLGNE